MRRLITSSRQEERQAPQRYSEREEKKGIFSSIYSDLQGRAGRVKERATGAWEDVEEAVQREQTNQQSRVSTVLQSAGAVGSVATSAVGEAFGAGVKGIANISAGVRSGEEKTMQEQYEEDIDAFKTLASFAAKTEAGKKVAETTEDLVVKWKKYEEENPVAAANIVGAGRMADFVATFAAPGLAKKAGSELITTLEKSAKKVVEKLPKIALEEATEKAVVTGAKEIAKEKSVSGATGLAKEYAERVPRAAAKIKEKADEAALRAERIAQSTPEVGQAIKVGLDDRFINMVEQADEPAKKAYKEMVDLAESKPKVFGESNNPGNVAGKSAGDVLDVLSAERKAIGKQIGEESKKLPTKYVSMGGAKKQMEQVLSGTGVKMKKGVLDFAGSNFTPNQRTKIKELYQLATEGLDKITARQVHSKDQLFSRLQREARMEQVADILVDLPGGRKKSMFGVFRDIYSNKLSDLSPNMGKLNAKYKESIRLLHDLEDSIFKAPNFNIKDVADPSEFAKVNLRRLMGESQSAPIYDAIMKQSYNKAKKLGFEGADPSQLINFAEGLRNLFPEVIPKTGFTGGVRTGIKSAASDLLGKAVEFGRPDLIDQQKALKALLGITEEVAEKTKTK